MITITTPNGNVVTVYDDKYGIHASSGANMTAVVKGIISHNGSPAIEADSNRRQVIIPCSQSEASHVATMLADRSSTIAGMLDADAEYDRHYNRVRNAMEG